MYRFAAAAAAAALFTLETNLEPWFKPTSNNPVMDNIITSELKSFKYN